MKREPPRDSLVSILLPLGLIFGLVLLLSLNGTNQWGTVAEQSTGVLDQAARWHLAAGAEIAAALVIGGAVLRGIGAYSRQLLSRSTY